jgi:hypothetical protein
MFNGWCELMHEFSRLTTEHCGSPTTTAGGWRELTGGYTWPSHRASATVASDSGDMSGLGARAVGGTASPGEGELLPGSGRGGVVVTWIVSESVKAGEGRREAVELACAVS